MWGKPGLAVPLQFPSSIRSGRERLGMSGTGCFMGLTCFVHSTNSVKALKETQSTDPNQWLQATHCIIPSSSTTGPLTHGSVHPLCQLSDTSMNSKETDFAGYQTRYLDGTRAEMEPDSVMYISLYCIPVIMLWQHTNTNLHITGSLAFVKYIQKCCHTRLDILTICHFYTMLLIYCLQFCQYGASVISSSYIYGSLQLFCQIQMLKSGQISSQPRVTGTNPFRAQCRTAHIPSEFYNAWIRAESRASGSDDVNWPLTK